MVISIETLTERKAKALAGELLALNDADWENWTEQNLLLDRPQKWELSCIARVKGALVAYAILSRAEEGIHLHHIAVSARFRSMGIGRALLVYIAEKGFSAGINEMTLKVYKRNARAVGLYLKMGFRIVEWELSELYKMSVRLDHIARSASGLSQQEHEVVYESGDSST